jgi:VCBS repeat-containing protein
MPDIQWIENYIVKTVYIGSIDGVTHTKTITVDGKDMTIEKEIVTALQKIENGGI